MEVLLGKDFVIWKIKNLSPLQPKECCSDPFLIDGCKWRILATPKGNNLEFSYLYLGVAYPNLFHSRWISNVSLRLTIVNKLSDKLSIVKDSQLVFDEKSVESLYPIVLLTSELLLAEDGGFLVKGKLKVVLEEEILCFAEAGASVVRLKGGGDPLVFRQGEEEMDLLQQQGIRVQVILGIIAASGIAAELGIPLTHRGVATSVRFLTGQSRKGGTNPLFIAENAADPDTTLVVYMGLETLPSLAQKLMDHGFPCDTPALAVELGTTPLQRIFRNEKT